MLLVTMGDTVYISHFANAPNEDNSKYKLTRIYSLLHKSTNKALSQSLGVSSEVFGPSVLGIPTTLTTKIH